MEAHAVDGADLSVAGWRSGALHFWIVTALHFSIGIHSPSREQVPDEAVGPGVAAGPGTVSIQTQVLLLKEAAEILGVSLRKAYKMHRAGELRGPAGKPYRACRRSVEELLETPRTMPDAAPSEPAPSNQAGQGQGAATQERRQPCRRERSPQGYQFFELP
jgi:hypothetical protein